MASNTQEKVRENRLRRVAERQGLRLVKSRRRDQRALDYGKWTVTYLNPEWGDPGDAPRAMSLDELERWLEDRPGRFARIRTMESGRAPHELIDGAYLSFTDRGVDGDAFGNLQDSRDALDVAIRRFIAAWQDDPDAAIFMELAEVEKPEALRLFAAHLMRCFAELADKAGEEF